MDNDKGDHYNIHPPYVVVFWKDGSACGSKEKWTDCDLYIQGNQYNDWRFKNTESDLRKMQALQRAFSHAYERGKETAKAEVRLALGV